MFYTIWEVAENENGDPCGKADFNLEKIFLAEYVDKWWLRSTNWQNGPGRP
jgi:hypothetical protein